MKSLILVLMLLGFNSAFAQDYEDNNIGDYGYVDCSLLEQDDVLTEDEYYDLLEICSENESYNKIRGDGSVSGGYSAPRSYPREGSSGGKKGKQVK